MAGGSMIDKKDQEKAPMSLLGCLREPLGLVAKVLEFGNKKYKSIQNFKTIENGSQRMADAAIRHIWAHADGEYLDPESHLPHLAHAACDAMMALWFEIRDRKPTRVLRFDADKVEFVIKGVPFEIDDLVPEGHRHLIHKDDMWLPPQPPSATNVVTWTSPYGDQWELVDGAWRMVVK